jgi:hypothetical protein
LPPSELLKPNQKTYLHPNLKTPKMTRTLFSFFLLFSITATSAQIPSKSTFSIKGQEWEYHNYEPKFGLFGKRKGFFEVTSFIYKVTAVKDSAGIIYSNIAKTGTSFDNPDLTWHRDFVVRSDGQAIYMPSDYYMIDTVFICDLYPRLRNKKVYSSLQVEGDSIQYPLGMDTSVTLKPNDFSYKNHVFDPIAANVRETVTKLPTSRTSNYKSKAVETERKITRIEKVRTPAGEFNCIRVHLKYEMQKGPLKNVEADEWFCPGLGIVRIQFIGGSYMELTRAKKKG